MSPPLRKYSTSRLVVMKRDFHLRSADTHCVLPVHQKLFAEQWESQDEIPDSASRCPRQNRNKVPNASRPLMSRTNSIPNPAPLFPASLRARHSIQRLARLNRFPAG